MQLITKMVHEKIWILCFSAGHASKLVDLQILCGPLETQEHKKTSHRPMNGFLIVSKHFPGFQEAIL